MNPKNAICCELISEVIKHVIHELKVQYLPPRCYTVMVYSSRKWRYLVRNKYLIIILFMITFKRTVLATLLPLAAVRNPTGPKTLISEQQDGRAKHLCCKNKDAGFVTDLVENASFEPFTPCIARQVRHFTSERRVKA